MTSLDDSRAAMLTGLVLAAREVKLYFEKLSCAILPVVYLRSDLWGLLRFSDKNKITQASSVRLEWDSDSLRDLVELRLTKILGRSVKWSEIDDGQRIRGSQSKWNHILDRTFLRPRDVIAFLNDTLSAAKRRTSNASQFINKDVVGARTRYSAYLKQELDDEISGHLENWEGIIQLFSSIRTQTFDLKAYQSEYESRFPDVQMSFHESLHVMFDFSIIGYQTRSGYGGSNWVFQYSHPEAQWDQSASRFKVHPGLKEYARLTEERSV